jgi:Nif11 domain
MLSQNNAAQLFNSLRTVQENQLRAHSLQNPEKFVQIAESRGYNFHINQLAEEVANLSEDELAAIWNPGIGVRRHLIRR